MQNCYNTGDRIPREKKFEVDDRLANKHIQTLQFVQEVVNENKVLKKKIDELELSTSNCDELHALAEESKTKVKTIQEQYLKRADEINAMMAEKHRDEVRQDHNAYDKFAGIDNMKVSEMRVCDRVKEINNIVHGNPRENVGSVAIKAQGFKSVCKRSNVPGDKIESIANDINVPMESIIGKVKETSDKFNEILVEKRNDKLRQLQQSFGLKKCRRNIESRCRGNEQEICVPQNLNSQTLHVSHVERKGSADLAKQLNERSAKEVLEAKNVITEKSMQIGIVKDRIDKINAIITKENLGKNGLGGRSEIVDVGCSWQVSAARSIWNDDITQSRILDGKRDVCTKEITANVKQITEFYEKAYRRNSRKPVKGRGDGIDRDQIEATNYSLYNKGRAGSKGCILSKNRLKKSRSSFDAEKVRGRGGMSPAQKSVKDDKPMTAKLLRQEKSKSTVQNFDAILAEIHRAKKWEDEENARKEKALSEEHILNVDGSLIGSFRPENDSISIDKRELSKVDSATISKHILMGYVRRTVDKINSFVANNDGRTCSSNHSCNLFNSPSVVGSIQKSLVRRKGDRMEASMTGSVRNRAHRNSSMVSEKQEEAEGGMLTNGLYGSNTTSMSCDSYVIDNDIRGIPKGFTAEEINADIEHRPPHYSSSENIPVKCSAEEVSAFLENTPVHYSPNEIDADIEDIPVKCSADDIIAYVEQRPLKSRDKELFSLGNDHVNSRYEKHKGGEMYENFQDAMLKELTTEEEISDTENDNENEITRKNNSLKNIIDNTELIEDISVNYSSSQKSVEEMKPKTAKLCRQGKQKSKVVIIEASKSEINRAKNLKDDEKEREEKGALSEEHVLDVDGRVTRSFQPELESSSIDEREKAIDSTTISKRISTGHVRRSVDNINSIVINNYRRTHSSSNSSDLFNSPSAVGSIQKSLVRRNGDGIEASLTGSLRNNTDRNSSMVITQQKEPKGDVLTDCLHGNSTMQLKCDAYEMNDVIREIPKGCSTEDINAYIEHRQPHYSSENSPRRCSEEELYASLENKQVQYSPTETDDSDSESMQIKCNADDIITYIEQSPIKSSHNKIVSNGNGHVKQRNEGQEGRITDVDFQVGMPEELAIEEEILGHKYDDGRVKGSFQPENQPLSVHERANDSTTASKPISIGHVRKSVDKINSFVMKNEERTHTSNTYVKP